MRNLFVYLFLLNFLWISKSLLAQAPEKMSYQSVIRNSSNSLVVNQSVRLRISILQGTINGSAVYSEQHQTTTNSNGLVTISIGAGTSQTGSFSAINWENGPYFVKMEADPTGGTNYTVSGTSQLLSVPYALHAKTAESIVGGGTTGGFTHYIGEQFGGGVIFSLSKDSQGIEHGLIVDIKNLSEEYSYGNLNVIIGSGAQSYWDGLSNSNAIVSQVGHSSSAALLCLNSTNGGFSDWYLPSIQELNLLWNNYFYVLQTFKNITGAELIYKPNLTGCCVISSTEKSANNNWMFDFENGGDLSLSYDKTLPYYIVRAIRKF